MVESRGSRVESCFSVVLDLAHRHLTRRKGQGMQKFTDLRVWRRSHALVVEVYRMSTSFPHEERFGLTAQLRRAVISVPANIAEGSKRQGNADYSRFLNIAQASLAETEYLLLLAGDLGYSQPRFTGPLLQEIDKISRMLSALRAKVGNDP